MRCFVELALAKDMPQFKDFPVDVYNGKHHQAVITKDNQIMRTRLRELTKNPVNFAGYYALTPVGCGGDCTFLLAIDVKTGKSMKYAVENDPPALTSCNETNEAGERIEDEYFSKSNSRLLVVTGRQADIGGEDGSCLVRFYEMKNNKLRLLKKLLSSDGNGESREVGNSTTTADNNQLKLRTTTIIELREGIVYIPNESLPFTGLQQKLYTNGKKQYETNIKDGKKNGLDTNWYENGQKKSEINHKDGEFNGLFTYWYENGQKRYEANYKDGKEDGLVTLWNENGQKSGEINYKDGEVVAPEKSSSEENWRTQCSSIASLAEVTMRARQLGVSMVKLMEAQNTSKLGESMIIAAYEIDRYISDEGQQRAIGEFRDKAYLNCLKTLKP